MRTNAKAKNTLTTHEGAPAAAMTPEQALRRSVMSCLLFESEAYEDGVEIAVRIRELAAKVKPEAVAAMAIEAREVMNLRHAPLWLALTLLGRADCPGALARQTIARVIQRADELTEIVAMYWRDGKRPLAAALKRALADAFGKFDEYRLAKYDRDGAVKLRDVLRLVHPKPADEARAELYARVRDRTLKAPDTWEVELSAGKDKRETFERLIRDGGLGYLALLRNLRGMREAGVNKTLMNNAVIGRKGAGRVLPFRYVAAARACPDMEPALDKALDAALDQMPRLPGKTVLVIDVSGSMRAPLSARSDMLRVTAAGALAAILRGICADVEIYITGSQTAKIAPRRGMALVDQITDGSNVVGAGGIFLKACMDHVAKHSKTADRTIVITDEQDCGYGAGQAPALAVQISPINYLINVASAQNGIGYGRWTHISGWSEGVVRYIMAAEGLDAERG